MRFKAIKFGKFKEEPEEEIIEIDKATTEHLAEMQEQISNKTKNLEETTQQLQKLSSTLANSDEEDEMPKPHGPIGELTVEPEDKMMDIDLDVPEEDLFEPTEEEINVVEVSAETATQPSTNEVQAETKTASDAKVKDDDDSFNNLFSSEEEDVNPLAALINSLPDVTAQELIEDLKEIKEIILDNKNTG